MHTSRLTSGFHILVVGAGGTGSHVLHGLARMSLAAKALGLPDFQVLAVDPDDVSPSNVARQLFLPSEVGVNKAIAIVNRLNIAYGLSWKASPYRISALRDVFLPCGMVIGCVDNARARRTLWSMYKRRRMVYWMDFGNGNSDGQVILGCRYKQHWLPSVAELFPNILQDDPDDDSAPSCSMAESLAKQDLFINQSIATAGLQILWNLLRHGETSYHGVFLNLAKSKTSPIAADPKVWCRIQPDLTIPGHKAA